PRPRTSSTLSLHDALPIFSPFKEHSAEEMQRFEQTAVKVFKNAKMVSDIASLNQAMVAGEIDLYLTGGTYTASPARADGFLNIRDRKSTRLNSSHVKISYA